MNSAFRNGAIVGGVISSLLVISIYSFFRKKSKNFTCIYLDYNATTPIYPSVGTTITENISNSFGNPSSGHIYGDIAKNIVAEARRNVGNLINTPYPDSIIFTSCGTESDNRAIDLALHIFHTNNPSVILPIIITSIIEHPAISKYLLYLQTMKRISLHIVTVNNEGFVSADDVEALFNPKVALVTIMQSNNEVGTIQPIRDIGQRINKYNTDNNCQIIFHSDAAQSIGKWATYKLILFYFQC
jgi:cysteine desulfurase